MATTQTASLNINFTATATKDGRGTTAGIPATNLNLTNGTTVNKADKAYYAKLTIDDSSTPQNLDFSGGGLIDLNGDTITWVEMVGLQVKADSANTVNVAVGGHANPLDFGCGANTIFVKPGEPKVLICLGTDPGYVITAGSADGLKFAIASGTNQIIEIFAIGRSA